MTSSLDWQAIHAELTGIETITDPQQLTKLSLDYYHFSPILQPQLADKRADLVVRPVNEAQVQQVAQVCVRHKIPLTVRGAGTGNYGQCIPLMGGIVLDTTRMNQILWIKEGVAAVEVGVKMAAFDKQARLQGWELRMYPSTYRTATLGGFIGGGSGGIGSINYGQLRDRGNVYGARVVTLEDHPRILTLRGDEVQQINHAYGTNGIITQLEIPLAPAYPWAEVIVTFGDFLTAARFGQALSDGDGLVKKLVTVCADPIGGYLTALQEFIPPGQSCALLMVAESSLDPLEALVKDYGGTITYQKRAQEAQKGTSLAEFTWNHTTLHARAVDPSLTYLQTFYFDLERVAAMYEQFGDEVMIHLEFLRVAGRAIPAGLQLVRYTTPERLGAIIECHEAQGCAIANPHTYILEDGGRKVIDPLQLAFKEQVDPYGLLNPGKMRAWGEKFDRK
ncbi:FAD-binding oxidoreductase [Spirulina subsalsa FACHB-351]|uniref:FAD-binding oxidoreductase n=1 Tax=Spirulina subsalsa FACHB-351 TaxID=234711 RepID=A0ABT3LA14_9CYAN|nr:FAD-binding oxidoreductase [Spirulina subsalsa]MCW6038347.1 FAD-binding oxidoreductase [Spirulina subsalsa FACHB-351]